MGRAGGATGTDGTKGLSGGCGKGVGVPAVGKLNCGLNGVAIFGAVGYGGMLLPDQAVLSGSRRASRASLPVPVAAGAGLSGCSSSVGPWGATLGRSPGNKAGLRAACFSRSAEKSPSMPLVAGSLVGRVLGGGGTMPSSGVFLPCGRGMVMLPGAGVGASSLLLGFRLLYRV